MRRQIILATVLGAGCVAMSLLSCDDTYRVAGVYCDTSADCKDPQFPVCNTMYNACVGGAIDGGQDLSADLDGGDGGGADMPDIAMPDLMPRCTAATVATDCTDVTMPICAADGSTCRACNSATDDSQCMTRGSKRCATSGSNVGRCVSCRTDTQSLDCTTSSAPVCGSDGTCRRCLAHGECPTPTGFPRGVCIFDGAMAGSCAATNQIFLVDNGNAAVAACVAGRPTRNGMTTATAYCDVSEAVTASRPFVVVAGSGQPYGAIALTDQSITIAGPGKGAATTARMFTAAMASVNMTVNSGARTVVIDGLDLGDSATPALRGIDCDNNTGTVANATLIVRDSWIHHSTSEGALSNNCALTLDANQIGPSNAGGGVRLISTVFTITNNIISGNRSGVVGVRIDDNPAGSVFTFNTVVGNGAVTDTLAGGIACNAATTIRASIVTSNSLTMASGTQFSGTCTLQNVVTGPDPATGANMAVPDLNASFRLNLNATNRACCINQVPSPSPSPATLDHDVDREARPRGVSATPYDVGADEAE